MAGREGLAGGATRSEGIDRLVPTFSGVVGGVGFAGELGLDGGEGAVDRTPGADAGVVTSFPTRRRLVSVLGVSGGGLSLRPEERLDDVPKAAERYRFRLALPPPSQR